MEYSLLFGAITWAVGFSYHSFTQYVLRLPKDKPSWTFRHWLLDVSALIMCISIANHFAIQGMESGSFSWNQLGWHVIYTFAVGIIPTALSGFMASIRNLQRNQKVADTITLTPSQPEPQASWVIPSRHQNADLTLLPEQVFYLEAMENYVAVYWQKEGALEQSMVRNTLTEIEKTLPEGFFRCHRSFVVSMDKIEQVEGNAAGLKLTLPLTLNIVPVSRKYIPEFRRRTAN